MPENARRVWHAGLLVFATSITFLIVQAIRSINDRAMLNADVAANGERIRVLEGTTREAIAGHININKKLDELLRRTAEKE